METVSINKTFKGQVLTCCYYGEEEAETQWLYYIFGFTNSIDFVTNTLPYVCFSGNISFCYNSIYELTSSLEPDHISFHACSFLLVQTLH